MSQRYFDSLMYKKEMKTIIFLHNLLGRFSTMKNSFKVSNKTNSYIESELPLLNYKNIGIN